MYFVKRIIMYSVHERTYVCTFNTFARAISAMVGTVIYSFKPSGGVLGIYQGCMKNYIFNTSVWKSYPQY